MIFSMEEIELFALTELRHRFVVAMVSFKISQTVNPFILFSVAVYLPDCLLSSFLLALNLSLVFHLRDDLFLANNSSFMKHLFT